MNNTENEMRGLDKIDNMTTNKETSANSLREYLANFLEANLDDIEEDFELVNNEPLNRPAVLDIIQEMRSAKKVATLTETERRALIALRIKGCIGSMGSMNNTENEMRGLDKIDNMDIAELRQILETVGVHPAALDAHPAFAILDRIEQQVKIANVILYLSERAITSQEEWYKEAYLAYRAFLLYDVIDEKDGVNKRTIYLAHLRRFCDSHPKYAPFLDEYIQEAEHQDGQEYWNNFDTISNAREDFILYATLSMEAPYEESI